MLRIGDTGRPSKVKHAVDIRENRWRALCGVVLAGWVTTRKKSGGFVLGDPANCPKCKKAAVESAKAERSSVPA